ncbi:unnamed protein product [Nezara viridula]|uniref:Uncharacterized protein n=1 Tax=Nezara viridula TaxID=85310 RepID=A0A9P0EAB6_NEZVI|nr:unnamed protein product [Nezara viridula]
MANWGQNWDEEAFLASIDDSGLPEVVINIDALSVNDNVNDFTHPSFNPDAYISIAAESENSRQDSDNIDNTSSDSGQLSEDVASEHIIEEDNFRAGSPPKDTTEQRATAGKPRERRRKRIPTLKMSAENKARLNTALALTDAYLDSHPAFDDISDYLEVIRLKNLHGYCRPNSNIVTKIPFTEFLDNIDDQYPSVASASTPIVQDIISCAEVERCILDDDLPESDLEDLAREKLKYYDAKEPTTAELDSRQCIETIPNIDEVLKYETTCKFQSSSTGSISHSELNALLETKVTVDISSLLHLV